MKSWFFVIFIFSLFFELKADLRKSFDFYKKSQGRYHGHYEKMIENLVNSGYYYTAVPFMKEYLVNRSGNLGSQIEKTFEKIIDQTGVQIFEKIPERFLMYSQSSYVKYILAKRMFFQKKYDQALKHLSSIPKSHKIYPYKLNLKASTYYLKGDFLRSLDYYSRCVNDSKTVNGKQSEVNLELCQAGVARSLFGQKKYKKAQEAYSKISKNSYIWPDLLFEEAWNSYYSKDYNRSLGKLVTYQAPVFKHIFKPEVYALQALSYLKLCHYREARKIASSFSSHYQNSGESLRKYIVSRGRDYRYYYQLISNFEKRPQLSNELFYRVLSTVSRGSVFQELKKNLFLAHRERKKIATEKNIGNFYFVLKTAIANTMNDLQILIGEYVRDELLQNYKEIYQTNMGMGFLRLEILSDKKKTLYGGKAEEKKGNIKNVKKAPYQYFWGFNGEFWADELGDYVFALKSECNP